MDTQYKNKLLDMLNYLDKTCTDNHLRYYAIGGTFLGAIRHNGFIPWDNDIDVAMHREDYNKFIEIVNSQNGKYVVETPQSPCLEYLYSVAKLYDTTTTLVENKKTRIKRGIFVDVFPMDGIADSALDIRKNYKKINFYNKLFAVRTCAVREQRQWWKNAAIIAGNVIPEIILNTKKLLIKLDKMCAQRSFDSSSFVGVLLTQYGTKYIMPRTLFDEVQRYSFENTSILGVKDYNTYLTALFGNWQQLPPEEKRVEGHDFIQLDLNHSYLDA